MGKHKTSVKKNKWLLQKPVFDTVALATGKQIEVLGKDNTEVVQGFILKSTANKLTVAVRYETMEISVDEVVNDEVTLDIAK